MAGLEEKQTPFQITPYVRQVIREISYNWLSFQFLGVEAQRVVVEGHGAEAAIDLLPLIPRNFRWLLLAEKFGQRQCELIQH